MRSLGLPSTALCLWGSSLANAALFALFYPAVSILFSPEITENRKAIFSCPVYHHGDACPSIPHRSI